MTLALYAQFLADEMKKLPLSGLPYDRAAALLTELVSAQEFAEFLTLPGYAMIS